METTAIAGPQAGIDHVDCKLDPTDNGHELSVRLQADLAGAGRMMVVETPHQDVWVSQTNLTTEGEDWFGVTRLFDYRDEPTAINPSDLRITLLTDHSAIDIQGC